MLLGVGLAVGRGEVGVSTDRPVGLVEPLEQDPHRPSSTSRTNRGRSRLRIAARQPRTRTRPRAPSGRSGCRGRPGRGPSLRRGPGSVARRAGCGRRRSRRGSASPRRRGRSMPSWHRARGRAMVAGRSAESRSRWTPAGLSTACILRYADPPGAAASGTGPPLPGPRMAAQLGKAGRELYGLLGGVRGVSRKTWIQSGLVLMRQILTPRRVRGWPITEPATPILLTSRRSSRTCCTSSSTPATSCREAEFWRDAPRIYYRAGDEEPEDGDPTRRTGWCSPTRTAGAAWRCRRSNAAGVPLAEPQHPSVSTSTPRSRPARFRTPCTTWCGPGGELRLDRTDDPEEPLRAYASPEGHIFCVFVA